MKADTFLVYCGGVIVALFAYVFVGGLVVRFVNSMYGEQTSEQAAICHTFWPFALPIALLVWVGITANRLSQWRPRRKSQLPGARVVKP